MAGMLWVQGKERAPVAELEAVRRKQHQKNKKISKDWEITEIIVTIVERQIRPSAVIRRDVNLPVIGSKTGKTRQCDIVIEEGYDARKTILIIAVKNRKSKSNINYLIGKMRDGLLNLEIFYSLKEAQVLIKMCRKLYNTIRPHRSPGYRPSVPAVILE